MFVLLIECQTMTMVVSCSENFELLYYIIDKVEENSPKRDFSNFNTINNVIDLFALFQDLSTVIHYFSCVI